MRPRPGQSILKVLARLKARGVKEVAGVAVQRTREWIWSREELIVLSRRAGASAPPAVEGLWLKEAAASDGPRYAVDIGTDSAATFRARLSDATRCFVVESEGRFVHATWMTTAAAWTREVGAYLCPPHRHAYVYESFTRAEVRGRGVYPFALRSIAGWLAREDVETVWVAVEASNAASRHAVAKAGFEPRFEIAYRRTMGRLQVVTPPPAGTEDQPLEVTAPGAVRATRDSRRT
jgi:Acetyltransferase (GNAT) family